MLPLTGSLESIKRQPPDFYMAVKTIIANWRTAAEARPDKRLSMDDVDSSRLSDVIFKYTGMKFKISLYGDKTTFAALCAPLDYNGILYGYYNKLLANTKIPLPLETVLRKTGKPIIGTVDLVNGRVGGDFSKLDVLDLILPEYYFAGEESDNAMAFAIFHEIGHAFSNFELLDYTASTNVIIQGGISAVLNTNDKKRKIAILSGIENLLGFDIENMPELINVDKYESYSTVLLSTYRGKCYSDMGSSNYEATISESAADNFAVQWLPPEVLVDGVRFASSFGAKKIRKSYIVAGFATMCLGVVALPIAVTTTILTVLGATILSLSIDYDVDAVRYDNPKLRIKRVRDQVIVSLKNKEINRQDAMSAIEAINQLDDLMEKSGTYNLATSTLRAVSLMLRPSQRKQWRAKEVQTYLESNLNNDLYKAAALFKV